ncbi:MAG: adenylyl-sulfate kinase [Chitinophagales bacterium]|nr:adenylyl-sulfate kinase [Chitinophagales bacterium]MDW8273096.1 adenylyl-sulfate kinase [Chitinophagales bacterium]
MQDIYPVFEKFLQKEDRERLLGQRAKVIWITGLSGSGKTTLAKALENELHLRGFKSYVLDGDNVRTGLCKDLGFMEKDRDENIRRVAETAKLFLDAGIITICSFITPLEKQRQLARNIIGKANMILVFLNTPLHVCEQRDFKGLYSKAKRGELENFTAVNAPYEKPADPDIILNTENRKLYDTVIELLGKILPEVTYIFNEQPRQYEQYNI